MDIRPCAESPAADQLANSSSADGTSTLDCPRRSELFTKFKTETSPKGMEARAKFKHLTTVKEKKLRSCYLGKE